MPSASAAPVSVIIPCYNGERFLGETIESVLAQSHPIAEILVVDDGSTDNTASIATSFKEVRCIRQRNQGVNAARNAGFAAGSGEFVLFLDADDRLLPDAIANELAALKDHPDWRYVSGEVRIIAEDGEFVREPRAVQFDGDSYVQLLRANYIWTRGSVLYRRTVIEEVGGFNGWASAAADYEINLRIARRFPAGRIAKPVIEYRIHGQNMSGDMRYMLKADVTVRRRERRHANRSEETRNAWATGLAEMREDYGSKLLSRLKRELRNRKWGEATVSAWILIRYSPVTLGRAIWATFKRLTNIRSLRARQ